MISLIMFFSSLQLNHFFLKGSLHLLHLANLQVKILNILIELPATNLKSLDLLSFLHYQGISYLILTLKTLDFSCLFRESLIE